MSPKEEQKVKEFNMFLISLLEKPKIENKQELMITQILINQLIDNKNRKK